jgi:hypothetical protein
MVAREVLAVQGTISRWTARVLPESTSVAVKICEKPRRRRFGEADVPVDLTGGFKVARGGGETVFNLWVYNLPPENYRLRASLTSTTSPTFR